MLLVVCPPGSHRMLPFTGVVNDSVRLLPRQMR